MNLHPPRLGQLILFLGAGLLLASCTPTHPPAAIATATSSLSSVAPTHTAARVTVTPQPTFTPRSSATPRVPQPTRTPGPSATPQPPLPTRTPTPTASVTPTSSPVPPLVAHTWQAEPVLLQYKIYGGDGCCPHPGPPRLILYADGRLFQTIGTRINDEYRTQVLVQQLSPTNVCAILNTIDQTGFFDYDPATYVSPDSEYLPTDGASFWDITVNAWQTKTVSLYALGFFIAEEANWSETCPGCPRLPPIPPSLRNTYHLLHDYDLAQSEIYQPEQLALRIEDAGPGTFGELWPLAQPTLSDLYARFVESSAAGQELVVEGAEAQTLYQVFQQSMDRSGLPFHDGTHEYRVYLRPLLPYEAPTAPDAYHSVIPSANFENPTPTLQCTPADGVLPIPTGIVD